MYIPVFLSSFCNINERGAGFMNNVYRFLTFVGFALPFLLTNKKNAPFL